MYGNGEGFVKVERLKGPNSFNAILMDMSMSSSECEQACLRNCSCTAFISMNIDGKGTRCLAWYGELVDVSENSNVRWDLNVRVDATELGGLLHLLAFFEYFNFCLFHLTNRGFFFFFFCPSATYTRKSNGFLGHKTQLAITIISVMVTLFLVCLIAYICVIKKRKTSPSKKEEEEENKR